MSSVAVNNVLPGRVGDLLRARWLQVAARIPGGRALATVFLDRVFDVVALVAFLAVSLPFVAGTEWLRRIAVRRARAPGRRRARPRRRARLHPPRARERRSGRGLLRRVARDTVEGLADPLGRLRALGLGGLSLAVWGTWAPSAWLVARPRDRASLVEAVFVTAVINLGVAIPSSPGFIGTYQWLGVSALALFDVPTEEALAFSILMQAVWYVPTLVVGGGWAAVASSDAAGDASQARGRGGRRWLICMRPRSASWPRPTRVSSLAVDVVLASGLALVVGVIRLGTPSFWMDESLTAIEIQWSYDRALDGYYWLYYSIEKPWAALGSSEAALRFPSVLGTMLACALLRRARAQAVRPARCARRRRAARAQPVRCQVVAQARGYTLLLAVSVLAILLLLRALERGTRGPGRCTGSRSRR